MKVLRIFAITIVSAVLACPAGADDVLDAARKERARREALKKQREKEGVGSSRDSVPDPDRPSPGQVLDNDGLKRRAGRLSVGSGSRSGGAVPAAPGESGEAADPDAEPGPKEEAFWRNKLQVAKNAVETARADVTELNQTINDLRRASSAIDDPNIRQQKSQELRESEAKLPAKQAAVQAAEKGVQAVREEARKAGVPAGWVR